MKIKRLHKILVCIMAVIMSLTATSVTAFAADFWSGTASVVRPSQTNDGFYLIQSGEDLAWFAEQVNADAGNATLKARLTQDIYLNDVESGENVKFWTPIANYSENSRVFSGIFDGKGFTIYGLAISSTSDYQGLFGYIENGQVRNVNISYANVSGGSYVGTIAGYANNRSSITQVAVEKAVISGKKNVGGISGYLTKKSNISLCGFSGEIKATEFRIGGITGCVFDDSTISQSYNVGTISTTAKYVGGIAGTGSAGVVISCYNRGNVSGNHYVAGIVGNNVGTDIASCYNASDVKSVSDPEGLIGAIAAHYYTSKITECFYDSALFTGKEDNGVPMATEDMKRLSFVTLLNSSAGNFYHDYLLKNEGYPILSWQADQNLWDGTVLQPKTTNDGEYYLINNGRELAWFAGLVNGTLDGVEQNVSANAMLMGSVVLNVGNFGEDSNVWTPIGKKDSFEYAGEFIGNGFSIRGLYIPSGDTVGLFGAVSETGSVSNFTITESYIKAGNAGGFIVGQNHGNVIDTKVLYSTIECLNNVGGIVGENYGVIEESSSIYSDVKGATNVGGIAGETYEGSVIRTCCSNNDIVGDVSVGGIAGNTSGEVSLSFNAGTVTANDSYAGGIAGKVSGGTTVSNCYNTGKISALSKAGGIAGQLNSNGLISCTYSVGEVVGLDTASTGINAVLGELVIGIIQYSYFDRDKISALDNRAIDLRTREMTGTEALDEMVGFSNEYWSPTSDSEFFVNYPQLDSFLSSTDYDLYDISVSSVSYLKAGLVCKVIGNNEISYYKTLTEASEKIGTGTAIIEIMSDLEKVDTEIVIRGNITIIPTNDSIKITRVKHYFGNVFTIKDGGILNFGAEDGNYPVLNINGNNVTDIRNEQSANSLITVEDGGIFNCYDVITTNNTAGRGGFVYNDGTVNFYGGVISDSTAIEAGGVAFNSGEMNVYAAQMTNNNAKLAGGAIFNVGGTLNIDTGADINNNRSGEGGAIYAGGGTVNLRGGSIYLNSAAYGGAICVSDKGKVMIYDGYLYNNSATVSGNAIYTTGTLNFYSGAFIDASNDVFLPMGETITMMAKSIYASPIVAITPETYAEGISVIKGNYTAMNANLCLITTVDETSWHINSGGKLTTDEIKYVLKASFFQSDEVPYTSIEEAMADIGENPAIIQLTDDIVLSETVIVKSNITIETDGIAHSIYVPVGFEGPMFSIVNGATLSLGTEMYEYESDMLYVNGSNVTADSVIDVSDGKLKICSGTVIFGANEIDSAVKVVGTVEMYGGKITGNTTNKGAVAILGGEMNFFGGTIFDNSVVGIFSDGTLNIYDGAGVDKTNTIYLTDGKVINVREPDPIFDEEGNEVVQEYIIPELIGNVELEKYNIDTSLISTPDELSKYSGKFTLVDSTYSLDDENIIRAKHFMIKDEATIVLDKNDNKFIYGLSVNSYTARGLCLQFKNENIVIYDRKGNIKGDNDIVCTGDYLSLIDGSGNAYRTVAVVIFGDVDCDGDVNANDAFITKMRISGLLNRGQFTEAQIKAMDVDHGGSVTMIDAMIMEDAGIYQAEINQIPY